MMVVERAEPVNVVGARLIGESDWGWPGGLELTLERKDGSKITADLDVRRFARVPTKEFIIDIVRALREPEYRQEISDQLEGYSMNDLALDAADEIERLSAAQVRKTEKEREDHV